MTNVFYNPSGNPGTGSEGLSATIRSEFAAIGLAFDILPQITTTGVYSTVFNQVGNYAYTLPAAPGTLATTANVATETTRATGVEQSLTTAVTLLAPKLIPTLTGLHETAIAMAANDIDCNAATIFTKTIAGITTFTVSNVPASGTSASFVLELTNGGAFIVNWWSNVKWSFGSAPGLTAAGTDLLGFYTINGGTAWRGVMLARDVR